MGYCNNVRMDNATWHYIYSDAGKKKRLSELLKIYGEINVIEVVVFRNCERCLLNLHMTASKCGKRCYTEVQFNENTSPKYNVMNLNSLHLKKCQIKFLIP